MHALHTYIHIYVNDMRAAISCKFLLYADDLALLTSGENVIRDWAISQCGT